MYKEKEQKTSFNGGKDIFFDKPNIYILQGEKYTQSILRTYQTIYSS